MAKPIVLASFRLQESRGDRMFYVSRAQGDGGKDWEWTEKPNEAGTFSYYWARRFMADRRSCNVKTAQAVEVAS